MPQLHGLIQGTLGYDLKKDFLANAIYYREVETFDYQIYAVDFLNKSPSDIQGQIKNEFSANYSGDVNVKVFNVPGSYQYPNDSLRAAKYNVSIERITNLSEENLSFQNPELNTDKYEGLDVEFFANYANRLLDFKEDFSFATKENGNREFVHNISFGVRSLGKDNSDTRETAKGIAQDIFNKDKLTPYGLATMQGEVENLANGERFKNYFFESYDLQKHKYSFGRRREEFPLDSPNTTSNYTHILNMTENGIIEVSEKGSFIGNKSFFESKTAMESSLDGSFNRCNEFYQKFYNKNILGQDSQYAAANFNQPLIDTPVKKIQNNNSNRMAADYEVTYTNDPRFSGNGTMTSQNINFRINEFDQVEVTQTFDYTINRIINNEGYITNLLANTTANKEQIIGDYYALYYPGIKSKFPKINLLKSSFSAPNIKTKYSASFSYSNSLIYFITLNGVEFRMLDYTVENKTPNDIINEYKVINRQNKESVLSYGYQTEKGQILIKINARVGKNSRCFYPKEVGSFEAVGPDGNYSLAVCLTALYKFGGSVFLKQFDFPTQAFNWFISDANYSIDSEGALSVELNYVYTLKKRNGPNHP